MNLKIKISIVSLLIIVGCGQTIDKDSLRETQEGTVIGMAGENNTFVWKGIPFAKPPIGELRWKAPQDTASRNKTLEAIEFKSACFQGSSRLQGDSEDKWSGSEDCLYLNIWTPQLTESLIEDNQEKLPVMMWIHGGGNTTGKMFTYN